MQLSEAVSFQQTVFSQFSISSAYDPGLFPMGATSLDSGEKADGGDTFLESVITPWILRQMPI